MLCDSRLSARSCVRLRSDQVSDRKQVPEQNQDYSREHRRRGSGGLLCVMLLFCRFLQMEVFSVYKEVRRHELYNIIQNINPYTLSEYRNFKYIGIANST